MALLGFRNLICHLFFVVANLFLSEINQINIYVTKWRMLQRNVKWVLTNQILWELNIEQKFKKLIKINRSYFFSYSVTSFIVIFIMPSCATVGCVSRSGTSPSLSFHQIPSYKRKEIRQEMALSYQTWTELKISFKGFDILLRAFWKKLFWKRSASLISF